MFEFITDTEERGQVGIGTLIVFIAMVLVAAIAAGVLINTAGFLQTQAEATGQDSTDLVSERIDVSSAVGIVDSAADGTLEQVRLTVSGAPGADDIDLGDTTIQGVGPGGQQNLVFAAGAVADNDVSVPGGTNNTDVPDEVNEFTTEIDVGVSELDSNYTLNVSHNGEFDTREIDPENNEDDQIVTVELTNVDPSTNVSENVSIALQDSGGNAIANGSGVAQDKEAVVKRSAESIPPESGANLEGDEISVPAEIDEDAGNVTVSVTNTTNANLTISAGDTTLVNDSLSTGTFKFNLTAAGGGEEIDPATVDQLEIELVDQDDATNVLDSGTVTTVDSVQSVKDLRADEFAVEDGGTFQSSAVLGNQDQYTVVLNPEKGALENTDRSPSTFGEGDSATLDLVSPAGSTTQVELRAPDLFNEDDQAIRL